MNKFVARKFTLFLVIVFALCLSFALVGCSGVEDELPSEFNIQYTDENGTHTIVVTPGGLYNIEAIPTKEGHAFKGLYDQISGGTQYINETGNCVSAFSDNKNLVLYPQFEANKYTILFDYQGAEVNGSRSLEVSYGQKLTAYDFPINLTLENKVFKGWYTKVNCGGTLVADKYGVVPQKDTINAKNYDLSDEDGYINLYAGFEDVKYIVTFYVSDNSDPEEIKVAHGTKISEVVTETRYNGMAVLSWSKSKNNTNDIFEGLVTSDMILYAVEYAPCIDFDTNGGEHQTSLVAIAGANITLPTPVRENYKFIEWQKDGVAYTSTVMPSSSLKLTAKWQAMLIFDERGGSEVDDISESQGTKITLPKTEKDGYMFAGWFTSNGEKYEITAMPTDSVVLQAKYYLINSKMVVLLESNIEKQLPYNSDAGPSMRCSLTLDLNDLYTSGVRNIHVIAHYQSVRKTSSLDEKTSMTWYYTNVPSEAYELWTYGETHVDTSYSSYVRETDIELKGGKLYICLWSNYHKSYTGATIYWKDFWVEVEYPDTSVLY